MRVRISLVFYLLHSARVYVRFILAGCPSARLSLLKFCPEHLKIQVLSIVCWQPSKNIFCTKINTLVFYRHYYRIGCAKKCTHNSRRIHCTTDNNSDFISRNIYPNRLFSTAWIFHAFFLIETAGLKVFVVFSYGSKVWQQIQRGTMAVK